MNLYVKRKFKSLLPNFGLTLEEVEDRLESLNISIGLISLCLSMASLVIGEVKNVLELGTGLGDQTAVLSGLFSKARIYTLDLPRNDPEFDSLAWRGLPQKKGGLKKFKHNIDR